MCNGPAPAGKEKEQCQPPRRGFVAALALSFLVLARATPAQDQQAPFLADIAAAKEAAERRLEEEAPHEWLIYQATGDALQTCQAALQLLAPVEWATFREVMLAGGTNPDVDHLEEFALQRARLSRAAPEAFAAYDLATEGHRKAQDVLREVAPDEFGALEAILLTERAGELLYGYLESRDRAKQP